MPNQSISAIDILNQKKPLFHPQSGTKEIAILENHFFDSSKRTDGSERTSYAISQGVLQYIEANVTQEHTTLETGAGYSTVVFAHQGKKHIAVNPDITSNQLILQFLKDNSIYRENLEFIAEPSDRGLPLIPKDEQLDFALIDGNHSFPIPIIDWHYIDYHLCIGGFLLVDNTEIRSVNMLCDYLVTDPAYEKVEAIGVTDVFKKVAKRWYGWKKQAMNML